MCVVYKLFMLSLIIYSPSQNIITNAPVNVNPQWAIRVKDGILRQCSQPNLQTMMFMGVF